MRGRKLNSCAEASPWRTSPRPRFLTPLLLVLAVSAAWGEQEKPQDPGFYVPAPGHWPGWRGPRRDNVSGETGLLKEWPEGGPKLLWKAAGAGDGGGPVSVAGGLLFVLGSKEDLYCISAFDGSGKLIWDRPLGPKTGEYALMRFLGQCSVTVDDDRVYACTALGHLYCLQSGSGKTIWEKEYQKDFGGQKSYFAYRESPLVDGPLLICAVGGSGGTLAALDKKTGIMKWRSGELKDPMPQTAVVAAEIGRIRQYVVLTMKSIAGIQASNGHLLWRADFEGRTLVATTPIVKDDIVLATSGYAVGWNAFKITPQAGQLTAEKLYSGRQTGHHRSVTLVGDHIYAADGRLKCFEFKTGTAAWTNGGSLSGSVLAADGSLIIRSEDSKGLVTLLEATPEEPRERGHFLQPDPSREGGYNQPVLAGGRLYLRDLDTVYCYDLRGPEYREKAPVWRIAVGAKPPPAPILEKGTDAVFVPTPQDVVDKMLKAAKVVKGDVVYDLGSGDGRIVIAASKKYGCVSVGFENNPELIQLSREKVKEAEVSSLVTLVDKDLFTADLSSATVITLYLGEQNNAKLLPKLQGLKPGVRIISHQHLLGPEGPAPEVSITMTSKEDGFEHTVYAWTTPLKR